MKMTIEGVDIPTRATIGACGYDIHAPQDFELRNGEWKGLDLGILMEDGDIPRGYFALIAPRSGLGTRLKFKLANTVGIIDSDYTMDTIKGTVSIEFHGDEDAIEFKKNDRILQMILIPHGIIPTEIPPTEERKGGHGSTGI